MTNTQDSDNKSRDGGNGSTTKTENSTRSYIGRTARINTDQSGVPIGVAVWLNTEELAALGVDPDRTDAVDVRVADGDLELTPAHAEGSDQ